MRNYFYFIFLLSLNTFADSSTDYFEPLRYQVGEKSLQSLVSGLDFPSVSWTSQTPDTSFLRSVGSNVTNSIIEGVNSLLKTTFQKSDPVPPGTPVVSQSDVITKALMLGYFAQTGVALQKILDLVTFNQDLPLFIYYQSFSENEFQFNFFDPVKAVSQSIQQVSARLAQISPTILTFVNMIPISSKDLEFRGNQFKAMKREGCGDDFKHLNSSTKSGFFLCMPDTAVFKFQLRHYLSGRLVLSSDTLESVQSVDSRIESFIASSDFSNDYGNCTILHRKTSISSETFCENRDNSKDSSYCPVFQLDCTNNGVRSKPEFIAEMTHIENENKKCPDGLEFVNPGISTNTFQYCTFSWLQLKSLRDDVGQIYNRMSSWIEHYFHNYRKMIKYELTPSHMFNLNPFYELYYKDMPSILINHDSSMFYNISNGIVSAYVSVKRLEQGLAISKTVNGISFTRAGSDFPVSLVIRDITNFNSQFKIIDRSLSFVTSDGYDLMPENSYLSTSSYGVPSRSIAQQFGIKAIQLPIQDTPIVSAGSGSGSDQQVPCGLNENVSVIRSRKASDGTVENYSELVFSPPCAVDWGKEPNPKNEKNIKELCPKEGEEGYDPECKENSFFKDSLKKLSDGLKIDSDSFKIKDMTSNKCVPLKLDFAGSGNWFGNGGIHEIKIICDVFQKSPSTETLFRTFFMISWFIMALFRLISA